MNALRGRFFSESETKVGVWTVDESAQTRALFLDSVHVGVPLAGVQKARAATESSGVQFLFARL
jgi:hypothetical protein